MLLSRNFVVVAQAPILVQIQAAPLVAPAGIHRYRPKGVFGKSFGNASEMRQNGSCFIGKRGTSKMRQKSVKMDDTEYRKKHPGKLFMYWFRARGWPLSQGFFSSQLFSSPLETQCLRPCTWKLLNGYLLLWCGSRHSGCCHHLCFLLNICNDCLLFFSCEHPPHICVFRIAQ